MNGIYSYFRKLFVGRYGMDNLSLTLLFLSAVFIGRQYLWIIGTAALGFAIFRIFSRDINKRLAELSWFNRQVSNIRQYISPVIRKIQGFIARIRQRKYNVFVKCPSCKKTLRLPKNKGKLSVTCPVCKHSFLHKT